MKDAECINLVKTFEISIKNFILEAFLGKRKSEIYSELNFIPLKTDSVIFQKVY